MSNLILGIDGGGSKTIAWLARVPSDVDGTMAELEIIGQGHSGPSNPWSVGFDAACANLALAIENAQENGAISNPSIAVACLGLAGAGQAAVKRNFLEWANHRKLADETIVIDDVEPLALAAAYERHLDSASVSKNAFSIWQQSITLVAGTGSIACGRNAVEFVVRRACRSECPVLRVDNRCRRSRRRRGNRLHRRGLG